METSISPNLIAIGQRARVAARKLARLSTAVKNQALLNVARAMEESQGEILLANRRDYKAGQQAGLTEALLDRLLLNRERLAA
ncbi:MAG: gamma-glutamyl-phosphate reductase, partial [Dehalococcoidia bacterium]|nr:gamma-glutamyl-phosphate reductase [Dehalococcoidia bacterium]